MVAKYGCNRQGLKMLVPRDSSSTVWQGIVGTVNILTAGACQCIENGGNTYFWLDKWVLPEPLITSVA